MKKDRGIEGKMKRKWREKGRGRSRKSRRGEKARSGGEGILGRGGKEK